ncbi:hypothetical protein LCGC14_0081920 [marine sediment metagenome]|uniref:Aquaporin Z n=1 Tax=marine sediment metagenome TaxID=412755 RepID=A0A0F9VLF5_9ZZZZ
MFWFLNKHNQLNLIEMKKFIAEFIGTLWLVLGGCGSAVIAAGFPELGIGFVGVSLTAKMYSPI